MLKVQASDLQMNDETLYSIRVESDHQQLLQMIGKRDTVIEASLRVILDSAQPWAVRHQPTYTIYAIKVE